MLSDVNATYNRLTENELTNLNVVLGAYRSFRGNRRDHIAYVGMPITTGKRYFDVLTEAGVKTREEFVERFGKEALWKQIVKPNIDEGIAFADELGRRENILFIAPSVFEAKPWRWTDDAYMSLWYRVIGELAGQHRVPKYWEYTFGGVREVMFSMFMRWRIIRPTTEQVAIQEFGLKNFEPTTPYRDKIQEYEAMWKMRVIDHEGQEIHLDRALALVVSAITDLKRRGFPIEDFVSAARKMKAIWAFTPSFYKPYEIFTPTYNEACEELKSLAA